MVEISRDGKRVYWTNSLYSTWDNQFYPDGVPGAQVMARAELGGGLTLADDYWVAFPDGYRAHQIRLEGGDCSTDSFCYPSVGTLIGSGWSQIGLWLAVVASGLYHGVNPAMGWPLAVSSGLMERSAWALLTALFYLAVGHVLAMFVVMVPFAMLAILLGWQREIQIGASVLVIGFGAFLLIWRRHPRVLARIPPSRLALWSFAVAIAHGAGLMLVPIYLGLCRSFDMDQGHQAAQALIDANLGMALLVSGVHATAMIVVGGLLAWLVYRYLGLKFVSRSWFNLDAIWASSLILVGTLSLAVNAN